MNTVIYIFAGLFMSSALVAGQSCTNTSQCVHIRCEESVSEKYCSEVFGLCTCRYYGSCVSQSDCSNLQAMACITERHCVNGQCYCGGIGFR